jgi:hypothetical protein
MAKSNPAQGGEHGAILQASAAAMAAFLVFQKFLVTPNAILWILTEAGVAIFLSFQNRNPKPQINTIYCSSLMKIRNLFNTGQKMNLIEHPIGMQRLLRTVICLALISMLRLLIAIIADLQMAHPAQSQLGLNGG